MLLSINMTKVKCSKCSCDTESYLVLFHDETKCTMCINCSRIYRLNIGSDCPLCEHEHKILNFKMCYDMKTLEDITGGYPIRLEVFELMAGLPGVKYSN